MDKVTPQARRKGRPTTSKNHPKRKCRRRGVADFYNSKAVDRGRRWYCKRCVTEGGIRRSSAS